MLRITKVRSTKIMPRDEYYDKRQKEIRQDKARKIEEKYALFLYFLYPCFGVK
jgi:hypothetical protein